MNLLAALGELLAFVPRWLKLIYSFFRGGKFIRLLIGGAVRTTPQLLISLFLFFGITLAVNNVLLPPFRDQIVAGVLALPETWVNLIALTKIDQAITVMMSAFAIAGARKIRLRPANPSLWS